MQDQAGMVSSSINLIGHVAPVGTIPPLLSFGLPLCMALETFCACLCMLLPIQHGCCDNSFPTQVLAANGVDSSLHAAADQRELGPAADHGMKMQPNGRYRRGSPSSSQANQQPQQQQDQQDGILALLSAALIQGVTDAPQQHNSNQDTQPAEAAPAAKKARTNSPPSSQTHTQAGPSAAGSQAAALAPVLQQQVQDMQDTFWQRALQGVQFYLGLNQQQQQQGSAAGVWGSAGFPPVAALGPEEQHALKQLLEPVRQAEVVKARQLLARLQGLDSAALPAAATAEPVAAAETSAQPSAGAAGLPSNTRASSGPGSPLAAALAAAAAAAENDMSSALSMHDGTAAAAAAAGAAAAAAAAAGAQQQEQPAEAQPPDGTAAAWLMPPDSNLQAWSASFMGPAAAMYGMNAAMNGAVYRQPAGRKATNNTAAASQQAWAAAQAAGAGATMGSAGSGGAPEGFSLRNPQFVGVYKSRRSEQGWRAQFSHANKVSLLCGVCGVGRLMCIRCELGRGVPTP